MDDNNILIKEKYYVEKEKMWEIYEGFGIDVMGCFIVEFWSED